MNLYVHAKKGGFESKAELVLVNGKINEIKIKKVKGYNPLKGKELKNFKIFLSNYANKIVGKWINYFVYHKDVGFEKISKKLK